MFSTAQYNSLVFVFEDSNKIKSETIQMSRVGLETGLATGS